MSCPLITLLNCCFTTDLEAGEWGWLVDCEVCVRRRRAGLSSWRLLFKIYILIFMIMQAVVCALIHRQAKLQVCMLYGGKKVFFNAIDK